MTSSANLNALRRHTQDFGENENQNHSDEQSRLLRSTTDTCVTNNANGEACSKTGETDGETGTKLDETSKQRSLLSEIVGDKDGHDQTVDGNDTSHDDRDDVWCEMLDLIHVGHVEDALERRPQSALVSTSR